MPHDAEWPIQCIALPGSSRHKACRLYSGQSAYTLEQRVVEVGSLGRCWIAGIWEAQVHDDHILREATHVDGAQAFITLEQQPGTNEQDDSQSDFDHKQHLAQRGSRAATAHGARCLMQRAEHALAAAAGGSD